MRAGGLDDGLSPLALADLIRFRAASASWRAISSLSHAYRSAGAS
jgi:hypothetical protein